MVDYLYEMGVLKRLPRAGWLVAGIDHPESVAEHSSRAAIVGYLHASMEGADPARTALRCLFHDTQESRIGDVPRVSKSYVVAAPNPQVTAHQVAGFRAEIGQGVRALIDDYEGQEAVEARLARDEDKLECLIRAREYQAHRNDVQPWSRPPPRPPVGSREAVRRRSRPLSRAHRRADWASHAAPPAVRACSIVHGPEMPLEGAGQVR